MTALKHEVITKEQYLSGRCYAHLDDPHGVAAQTAKQIGLVTTNPYADDSDPVQIVVSEDGVIVGREDLVPSVLMVEGEPVRTNWGSNMYVPPVFRGKGIGKLMVRAREEASHTPLSNGVSQMLLPIYKKYGYTDYPSKRLLLLRRSKPVLEALPVTKRVASAVAPVADVGMALYGSAVRLACSRMTRNLTAVRVDRVDDAFSDAIANRPDPIHPIRSSAWMNWCLEQYQGNHAAESCSALVVRCRQNKEPLGFVMTTSRFHKQASSRGFKDVVLASVKEWVTLDAGRCTNNQLVMIGILHLLETKPHAIEVCARGSELVSVLKKLGFVSMGQLHSLHNIFARSPLCGKTYGSEQWRIRPADGDHFFT